MAKQGLYANINAKKKAGTSNTKKKSTITPEAYANMQAGFPKKKKKAMYGGTMTMPKKKMLSGGQVKLDVFNASARNYESALEASLKPNNIPTDVYHALVNNVNNNLETFQRYLSLKKRMMGLDTLKYSDLYASAVKVLN